MKKNTDDGAKIYTPLTLKLYDWWVLGVSNRLAWGCPTKEHLLPHFLEHVGNNHLDIGVGTGFYLTHVPESSLISLMDLNEASLNAASTRAGESKIKHKISHDVFEPYPAALHGQFDSISMFYLLHCLPGNISTKSCVIRNAAQALTDDGTLYGATILGDGVVHNSFGQNLMRIYNQKGIFSNTIDSEVGVTERLSEPVYRQPVRHLFEGAIKHVLIQVGLSLFRLIYLQIFVHILHKQERFVADLYSGHLLIPLHSQSAR